MFNLVKENELALSTGKLFPMKSADDHIYLQNDFLLNQCKNWKCARTIVQSQHKFDPRYYQTFPYTCSTIHMVNDK